MKITGVVKEITDTYIRIVTTSKKQEIDVFFTESKSSAMNILFQPHMTASLIIDYQAIEIGFVKLAKLWFVGVLFPPLPDDDDDLNSRQRERREQISVLYKNIDFA